MEVRTMRPILTTIICILISATAVSAAPVLDQDAQRRIDAVVAQAIEAHTTPSACVVIGTKDGILYAKAYGHLTYEADSPPATLDTIYDLASVSKAVGTTSTAMMLVHDGKLSLDDPVSKYLPDWNRDDRRDVTIRHLITHTSGLPSYTSAEKAEAQRRPGEPKPDALIRYIASLPLAYETGKGHIYACLNFLTLARVNEEVAGVCQETFLRRRLFVPLGMLNSGYYLSDKKKLMAAPTVGGEHFRQGRVHDPLADYYCTGYRCSGNAGLFSTANDLSKFCRMMLSDGVYNGHRIFAPETIDLFSTNALPEGVRGGQGVGWGLSTRQPFATPLNNSPKKAVFTHAGYTGTYIHFDRLAGTFLVVLTNRVYPDDKTSDYRIRTGIRRIMLETAPIYKGVLTPATKPN
ncbi:MAG: serine hydrolase [Armatimonadetes bacterium]|nr:serine hydrolase [Armatimonadota bacterium]